MRSPSILQPHLPYRQYPSGPWVESDPWERPKCYITSRTDRLDVHHIYPGPNREISDEMGFWVYLNHDVHMALHDGRRPFESLKRELQKMCQEKYEETHTRREFMDLIGRSYL